MVGGWLQGRSWNRLLLNKTSSRGEEKKPYEENSVLKLCSHCNVQQYQPAVVQLLCQNHLLAFLSLVVQANTREQLTRLTCSPSYSHVKNLLGHILCGIGLYFLLQGFLQIKALVNVKVHVLTVSMWAFNHILDMFCQLLYFL